MKLPACLLLVLASLLVGPRVVVADDVPEDTNTIESLTVEQATQLVREFPGVQAQVELKGATLPVGGCLPLNGVKSLDADTATMLADFDGLVFLNGLATLDADTATALAQFKGPLLHINGLTTLDADTARALAAYQGHYLLLNGLATLDADTARALAGFKGKYLHLNGLTTLDADTAKALVESTLGTDIDSAIAENRKCLYLNGLITLDAATAEALAGFQGKYLHLDGLTTLDAATAEALAGFQGKHLHLDGLTTLDAATAGAIAEVRSSLSLDGLTTLDADTAMLLAGFKGHNLSLSGLTTLAADAATTLVAMEKWNGHLPAFSAFESPDSVAVAEALATRKGQLALPNLTRISPKTLSALIEKEDIEIPRIKTLQLIPEPDGSPTEDFVIPERFRNR